ncbi:MAG: hypothetical protein KF708_15365 [Pirellulales bacterium]|nr:hypothetical protein [Pirellulales bacterium]
MTNDMFERLADVEVPPLPEQFDEEVHTRVNRVLLVTHVAEFFLAGAPFALARFARALVGLIVFTVTGKADVDRPDRPAP